MVSWHGSLGLHALHTHRSGAYRSLFSRRSIGFNCSVALTFPKSKIDRLDKGGILAAYAAKHFNLDTSDETLALFSPTSFVINW